MERKFTLKNNRLAMLTFVIYFAYFRPKVTESRSSRSLYATPQAN